MMLSYYTVIGEHRMPTTPHTFAPPTAVEAGRVELTIKEGWDVFTIPHGGYLLALAGQAVLAATEARDIFTITVHYLRKAAVGPLAFDVTEVGGSRRFTTVTAVGTQDGQPVLSVMASVGQREDVTGPTWHASEPWDPAEVTLSPRATDPELGFPTPAIAHRFNLQLDLDSVPFVHGRTSDDTTLRAVMDTDVVDQLTALLACDVTMPAAWNALGSKGWVPTLELTAHVRARPVPGPLRVTAVTRHVQDGLLEEDAEVHDHAGTLIVQSRQLAIWSQ